MTGRAACLDSRSRPTSSLPPPRADVRLDPAWTLVLYSIILYNVL